ncbi:MAG TPA: hypothetical protein PKE47_17490, partial [Verrucomicrobiota bacterium]|nr:hypothetical protein [Verrucomicrobiota bacterium]
VTAARRLVREAASGFDEPALVVLLHAFVARAAAAARRPMVALHCGPWAEEYLHQRRGGGWAARLVAAGLRREERRGLRRARRILAIRRPFSWQRMYSAICACRRWRSRAWGWTCGGSHRRGSGRRCGGCWAWPRT